MSTGLKKMLEEFNPKMTEIAKVLQTTMDDYKPIFMKQVIIENKQARLTLCANYSVRIEFEEKDYGKKYYDNIN